MRVRHVVLMAIAALLLVPAMASAKQVKPRSFEQTYPVASKLCAKADAGTLPKKLQGSKDKVLAECATLKTSFATAQTTYAAATDPLKERATAIKATADAACVPGSDKAACRAARKQAHVDLKALHTTAKAASKAYVESVKAGRKTFWSAIRALKGGKGIATDGVLVTAPVTDLPS